MWVQSHAITKTTVSEVQGPDMPRLMVRSLSVCGLLLSAALIVMAACSLRVAYGYCAPGFGVGCFLGSAVIGIPEPLDRLESTYWSSRSLSQVRKATKTFWDAFPESAARTGVWIRVPLWMPLLALFPPSLIVFRHSRRPNRGYCSKCGYDLTGNVSGTCPECGVEIRTP